MGRIVTAAHTMKVKAMVKQKLFAINCDSYWVSNARGKVYQVYMGRGVKRSQLKPGMTVEIGFHNHKGYIEEVC